MIDRCAMTPHPTLVIASGNPLRGDDAIGSVAADIVQSWRIPGVNVLAVHQLVPELIDEIKRVQRVLFIDAAVTHFDGGFQAREVEPNPSSQPFGHFESAANLMALLRKLDGVTPAAWLVSITAASFEHGDPMTATAQSHLDAALAWIRDFLTCDK